MEKESKEEELFGDDFDLFNDIADMVGNKASNIEEDNDNSNGSVADNIDEDQTEDSNDNKQDELEVEDDSSSDEELEEDTEESKDAEYEEKEGSSPLTPYAKFLIEEGILTTLDLDTFDGSADGLKNAMQIEISGGIDSYKNSLPDSVKTLINNYEAGVPFDKLLKLSSEKVKYESIGESEIASDEDLQKSLVKEYLKKTTKFSDEKIEKHLNRLSDFSELEGEAKDSLSGLKEIQLQEEANARAEAENQKLLLEESYKREIKALDDALEITSEIVPNVSVTKKVKDNIKKNLTTVVGYDASGNPLNKVGKYRSENPIQFEITLNYIYEVTNGFKDWSTLSKAGKRSAISELEAAAKGLDSGSKSVGTPHRHQNQSKTKGLSDAIDRFNF